MEPQGDGHRGDPWAEQDRPPDDRGISKVPGQRSETWMAALATILLVAGAALGVAMLALQGAASGTITITAPKTLRIIAGTVGITVLTLVAHEGLHGLGMLACRARPRFGAGIMAPGMPYLYTTSEGHQFTRPQYLVIAMLPNVLINLALVYLIGWGPHAAWWVVPFAVHLSGGVGDAWLCWATLAEPRGTLVEDQRAGIRVTRPLRQPRRLLRRRDTDTSPTPRG